MFTLASRPVIFLAGTGVGIAAFGVLMLVLLPVLRHKSTASLGKGFAAIAVSGVLIMTGVIAALLFFPEDLLVLFGGELVSFFVCWIVFAVTFLTHLGRPGGIDGKGKVS
ncbi:MAG: hypothetical protein E7001_02645 [Coriobacteriaceae bacterium]|nr:hypothetical protein [Coriobacteriaceae bacterium]